MMFRWRIGFERWLSIGLWRVRSRGRYTGSSHVQALATSPATASGLSRPSASPDCAGVGKSTPRGSPRPLTSGSGSSRACECLRMLIQPRDRTIFAAPVYPKFYELIPEAGGTERDVLRVPPAPTLRDGNAVEAVSAASALGATDLDVTHVPSLAAAFPSLAAGVVPLASGADTAAAGVSDRRREISSPPRVTNSRQQIDGCPPLRASRGATAANAHLR